MAVPQVKKKLNHKVLQNLLPKLDKAVGKDSACVIAAWMSGYPERGLFGDLGIQAGKLWNDLKWYNFITPLTGFDTAAKIAGAAGEYITADKIYAIEDHCPGGPKIDIALANLANPVGGDPVLFYEVIQLGTGHRAYLIENLAKNTADDQKRLLKETVEKVYDGTTGLLKKTFQGLTGLAFGKDVIQPILFWGGLGLIAYLVYKLRR